MIPRTMWRYNFVNVSLCIWFLLTLSLSTVECNNGSKFSQSVDSVDGFVPMFRSLGEIREIPKKDEQHQSDSEDNLMNQSNTNPIEITDTSSPSSIFSNITENVGEDDEDKVIVNEFFMEIKNLQEYFFNFFDKILTKDSNSESYEIASGIRIEPVNNSTNNSTTTTEDIQSRKLSSDTLENLRSFAEKYNVRVNMPRAVESGRLFFFSGE